MSVYYNEIDPFAVKWLRNLIEAGLIPKGDVDDRSIVDVRGDDLRGYEQCHFFAGIGGWAYALQLAGWEGECWTGSCPCQPFSVAGAGKGTDDERHLWPAFRRLISECRPPVVFGEQVASKDGRLWLAGVRADLEACGYGVGAADLAAASVGAPHIRQRLYWLADAGHTSRQHEAEQKGRSESYGSTIGLADATGSRPEQAGGRDTGEGRTPFEPRGDSRTRGLADNDDDGPHRAGGVAAVTDSDGQDGGLHRGSAGRVGHTDDAGPQEHGRFGELHREQPHGPQAVGSTLDAGLGLEYADRDGCGQDDGAQPAGSTKGHFWSEGTALIQCGDDKIRRVAPGIPLLAHGVPNRVGRLRGYGNAIVPQVAAEFIGAYMDMEKAHLSAGLAGGAL